MTTGVSTPSNLPMTNCRRLIGFESTVSAVRPSTSSAIETLADETARMIDSTRIIIKPGVFHHLDVVAERAVRNERREHDKHEAERDHGQEQRLRARFFRRGANDGADRRRHGGQQGAQEPQQAESAHGADGDDPERHNPVVLTRQRFVSSACVPLPACPAVQIGVASTLPDKPAVAPDVASVVQ